LGQKTVRFTIKKIGIRNSAPNSDVFFVHAVRFKKSALNRVGLNEKIGIGFGLVN
jgi:hypothetical protein